MGLSFDYVSLNMMGFIGYSIFNIAFYFDPKVQQQYRLAFTPAATLSLLQLMPEFECCSLQLQYTVAVLECRPLR